MNEQRQQAYLDLIQTLLNSPSGQENEILQGNQELVDAELVRVMGLVADKMAEDGNHNAADRLGRLAGILAQRLGIASEEATPEEYLNFLTEVLQAVSEDPSPQSVYPLLQQNLDLLDENLQRMLKAWAAQTLPQAESEKARYIAGVIANFSALMIDFPLGDRSRNVEIAIAGNEIALTVLTKEAFLQNWARTQNNLGNAYCDRIKGDKAENIEEAIAAYGQALSVKTFEAFPQDWAATQNNLGAAYRNRIKGDKAENIEQEIAAYGQALSVWTFEAFPQYWATTQNNLGGAYRDRIKGDKAENIEQAIAAYGQALSVYTFEAFPQEWAATQNNLGLVYWNRIKGDKAENIEEAIAAYGQALSVYTFEAFPQEWADTQYNLGTAYSDRIKGDKAENIEEAIAAYGQALSVRTFEAFPQEWAMTQYNLGIAYGDRIKGDKAENIEEAIAAYGQALSVRTFEAFPQDWAMTQNNLAIAYSNRIKGDKAENIEEAIAAYGQALSVRTFEAFPQEWADTQYNLGIAYGDRIKGDKAENIEEAIAAYGLALSVWTFEAFPFYWARTQHNLGTAYSNRIKGDKAENIEEAIAAFRQALSVSTFEAYPQDWAMTQNNLGAAYSNRIKGDKAENIEEAIAAYGQALSVRTFEAYPQDWAATQNNLGTAYSDRIKGDKAKNIEEAIAAFRQALSVWTFEAFPQYWASAQNNLAIAYSNRIKGDKAENIEEAIAAYGQALSVRTFEAFPQEWADTQYNLGIAYGDRIKGDKAENIEEAIAAYGLALSVWTFEAFPFYWARTQHNLGTAYSNRIKGDKAENIEEAIAAFRQALSVSTFEAYPQDWAMTQNNLGAAYSNRIKGDKAENIEEAIAAYGQALSVRTFEAFPQDWAMTQNNLGGAYRDRIKGDKAENIKQAIAAFRQALSVLTPQNFPIECLIAGRNLGNLGFNNGNWQVAVEGYQLAIEAVEQSRRWAVSEERRQEILQESLNVYENMVQACVNLGQVDKAIEYVERSRSQRLVDLMASNDLYRGGEIPPEVEEKLQEYEALQQKINQERSRQPGDNQGIAKIDRGATTLAVSSSRAAHEAYSKEIGQLEAQKQQVLEKLRKLNFELASQIQVSPLNIAAMQQLIASPTAAILSFYTTDDHTHIFILRQNQAPQLHTCTGQGYGTLQKWIEENRIQLYVDNWTEWRDRMSDFLAELAQRLQLEDLIWQQLGDIQELIIVPHLYLHQIPFAALPINQLRECLIDKFVLRTVPSCQILEFCHRRLPAEGSSSSTSLTASSYGIVEDATEDLPYAAFECSQIAQMYDIPENQRLKGRQGATVKNYRQLAKQVQVLHSSHHAKSSLDKPLESYLQLGDDKITLGELMSPGWRLPKLEEVFLSCCETGFGKTEITDDIITIAAGFLCAGARSVVGTLWEVNDVATALLCVYYYELLRRDDKSRSEALREAQVRLRNLSKVELKQWLDDKQLHFEEGSDEQIELDKLLYSDEDNPLQHPYYWAGFCIVGL